MVFDGGQATAEDVTTIVTMENETGVTKESNLGTNIIRTKKMTTKICNRCGEEKSIRCFYHSKTYCSAYCKPCQLKYQREYRRMRVERERKKIKINE